MFWILWTVGSALNVALVSIPFWLAADGWAAFRDLRVLAVLAVLHLWIGCDLSIPVKDAAHYRDVRVHHREQHWFPHLCGLLVLGAVWVLLLDAANPPDGARGRVWPAVGGALAASGLGLRFWAVRSLGSFFTEELKILTFQPLVTSGPYRWIRHPSYAAIVLILLGAALVVESRWALAYLVAVIVPMVILRVAAEERLLRDGFGKPFADYRARTWRLIPALY